jgi:hypothetical protein
MVIGVTVVMRKEGDAKTNPEAIGSVRVRPVGSLYGLGQVGSRRGAGRPLDLQYRRIK